MYHSLEKESVLRALHTAEKEGLSDAARKASLERYGRNTLEKKKKKSLFSRILESLTEPMLLILVFSLAITFGANLGKFLKSGEGDFIECAGILFSIVLSVTISLVMEGSSERAFRLLAKMYDNVHIRVIRGGKTVYLPQEELCVGDIVLLSGGDKIAADGRLLSCVDFRADESALTGESAPVKKDADLVLNASTPLAERRNMVYAGTFAEQGTAVMAVTAVGGGTEMGNIAGELSGKVDMNSPLQQKLAKLGKVVTAVGAVAAVIVFVLSIVRLALGGNLSFETVGDVFITSIVLVVAAVPEGLPTIVAVSLALNMIKLARENALIRKLIATETAGCVSVICSDKTGTLTENRMTVDSVCAGEYCQLPEKVSREILKQNFALNATAEIVRGGKKTEYRGNATECALLTALEKADKGYYERARERYPVLGGVPFSSERKYMMTTIGLEKGTRTLLKGAPEAVLPMTNLTAEQRRSVLTRIGARQKQARRVIAFAHADGWSDGEKFIFDGFVTITDPVRKDVKDAVRLCRRAGIEVKMLTGDNYLTASAVARELNLIQSDAEVISASDLEGLSDDDLKKLLRRVKVVARSTPATKLAVVRALKECGEVVAVTGDGHQRRARHPPRGRRHRDGRDRRGDHEGSERRGAFGRFLFHHRQGGLLRPERVPQSAAVYHVPAHGQRIRGAGDHRLAAAGVSRPLQHASAAVDQYHHGRAARAHAGAGGDGPLPDERKTRPAGGEHRHAQDVFAHPHSRRIHRRRIPAAAVVRLSAYPRRGERGGALHDFRAISAFQRLQQPGAGKTQRALRLPAQQVDAHRPSALPFCCTLSSSSSAARCSEFRRCLSCPG